MRDKLIVIDENVRFSLDLSEVKITYQEESPRFKDGFSTKFTFPFEFNLDRDLRMIMGDFASINTSSLKTLYKNCILITDGVIKEAKLEILGSVGEVVRCQIDLGFEQFPNWDKKLNDLPLEEVSSTTKDMISVANQIITKTYPNVNYNFPMVHTDIYKDNEAFSDFQGIINKRVNGAFIENEENQSENTYLNKNLVIPMPYWLYVLKVGFEDAGFTLHGDVLSNSEMQNMLIAPFKAIEAFNLPDNVDFKIGTESYTHIKNVELPKNSFYWFSYGRYEAVQEIMLKGRFRIRGKGNSWASGYNYSENEAYISWNDVLIYSTKNNRKYSFDFIVETDLNVVENKLKFIAWDLKYAGLNTVEIEIIPLEIWDENGKPKLASANIKNHKLSDYLPDSTFGHLVTCTKNLFNLDFEVKNDTEVWMNYINNSFDKRTLKDITKYEVEAPERGYEQSKSFLLQYAEIDNDEYKIPKIFFNKDGAKSENYNEDENTKKIEISALPLPLKTADNIRTAHQFMESSNFYQIVLYNGLIDNENVSKDTQQLDLNRVFQNYWLKWLRFRVMSTSLNWKFLVNKNRWRNNHILDTYYAYRQKLWIKRISKTSLNKREYEIEIECDIVRN